MNIPSKYISPAAGSLMQTNDFAKTSYQEIEDSILSNHTAGSDRFIINCSEKNCNGVVPVKEQIYIRLETNYDWFREKPLPYFQDAQKGGPIDVYKEFGNPLNSFHVGLEFETGNISSAHRSMNKLCMGIKHGDLQMAFLIMPIKRLAYYLTDRISNYEELAPYFGLLDAFPFVVFGFDADHYDANAPLLPKGRDGMSKRSLRKWKNDG